jgi:hypothetical protein
MVAVKRPGLIERIRHVARETNRDTTQVVEAAVQAYLDPLDRDKIHEEAEAFWAMQADLIARYPGEYVAVHQGQVVDHDPDVVRLEQRVEEQWGQSAILIAPVTDGRHWRATGYGNRFAQPMGGTACRVPLPGHAAHRRNRAPGTYVVGDERSDEIALSRNVLNHLMIWLDGPANTSRLSQG